MSSETTKNSAKWRWLWLGCGMLVLAAVTVAGCGLFALQRMGDVLAQSGYTEAWDEGVDGESIVDIPYGDKERNKLDMYIPKELAPEKSHCAFVYVHGGAWMGGSRRDMTAFARRMTKAGYVSASFGYTLVDQKNRMDYSIFKVLDEIDAAMAKLKAEAAERGIELERVAMGGDSAGGHIISLYAYSRGKNSPLPVVFIAPRVGPIDFHADAWDPVVKPDGIGLLVTAMNCREQVITAQEILEPSEEIEKLIDAVSPLSYLTADNTIPTVSAYGGKDPLVGTKHCAKIAAKFAELGAKSLNDVEPDDTESIVFDYLEYPNSGHMLESDPDYAQKFHALVLKYAERYLND